MNKRQNEIERLMLDYEKQCVKDLQKTYTEALADVKLKLRSLLGRDQTLSVAYQIEFQRTLEAQLQSAVDTLKSGSITSVTDFLNKTYEDGYLGTIYSIQGQGIPINIGVDHKQLARVVNRKTDSFKFSDRLYKNVDELAVAFKSEMTRGIANDSGYTMIARQLSLVSDASYKRALTIVRTEGGRVKSEAKLDSMKAAKDEGADIVKQWDATFDGKTRPEHRFLDGQIREIDEPFTDSQGRQAQAPHKFGVAGMDINCRCIVVERARWAVEGEEMPNKVHNHTGDLVEAEDYKEWKEKAQKQLNEKKEKAFNKRKEELEKNGVKVFDKNTKKVPKKGDYFQTANKELVEVTDVSDYDGLKVAILEDGEAIVLKNAKDIETDIQTSGDKYKKSNAKSIEEAEAFASKFCDSVSFKGATNLDNVNIINGQLDYLESKYPAKIEEISVKRLNAKAQVVNGKILEYDKTTINGQPKIYDFVGETKAALTRGEDLLEYAKKTGDKKYYDKVKRYVDTLKEDIKYGRMSLSSSFAGEKSIRATTIHEYGHLLKRQAQAQPYIGYVKQQSVRLAYENAVKNGDIYKISRYASKNENEFFSEVFTMYEFGESLPDYIVKTIEGVLKK